MARYAIGDLQGCAAELQALLQRLDFHPDRDRLWFVGDLVNRGPQSLECLRLIRSLGDNAVVVLGNHDLHLLALAFAHRDPDKPGDTLAPVLRAPDRDVLLEWLLSRPLLHFDAAHADLMVHAGLVPQWTVPQALALAAEVEAALRTAPERFFEQMYGDEPDRWDEALTGAERLRFIVNTLTRLRVCTEDGRVDLEAKGAPRRGRSTLKPWFEIPARRSRDVRIIFGHWSTLGYVCGLGVIGLDTGCVWGGELTAVNLDTATVQPISVPCRGYQLPGDA